MTTIISGSAAAFTVTVQLNGKPVHVTSVASASIYDAIGHVLLATLTTPTSIDASANWPIGVVAVAVSSVESGLLPVANVMLVLQGDFGVKRFKLLVDTVVPLVRTSLFIKDIVIEEMRNDRLIAAAAGVLQDVVVSDDYLWDKVRVAESEISHALRVPLVPTRVFNVEPTPAEIAALDGMAWMVESAPDYSPDMFERDKWGYITTRQKPIISVEGMRFVYPTEQNGFYDIPLKWLSIDYKYGQIRIVPTSSAVLTGLAGLVMMNLAGGRTIPSMVRLVYTAGLKDAANTYPELLDAIKKTAVLKVISDAFLPQSGSISADGLSESMSVDMDKYHDIIDTILNGSSGSNGGLMAAIHGVRSIML